MCPKSDRLMVTLSRKWYPFIDERSVSEALGVVLANLEPESKGFTYVSFIAKSFEQKKAINPQHFKNLHKFCQKMGYAELLGISRSP